MDSVKEEIGKNGLNMNVRKTKAMIISKARRANLKVDGKTPEQVRRFKNLGQVVNEEGRCDQEITKRITQTKSTFVSMKNILTPKEITFPLRLRLVKYYVFPVVLYGDETWTLYRKKQRRKYHKSFKIWLFGKRVKTVG